MSSGARAREARTSRRPTHEAREHGRRLRPASVDAPIASITRLVGRWSADRADAVREARAEPVVAHDAVGLRERPRRSSAPADRPTPPRGANPFGAEHERRPLARRSRTRCRLPSRSQKRMSCSMTRSLHGRNGPCKQMAHHGAVSGHASRSHAQYMQSRYVRGLTVRSLQDGDTETVSALFARLGERSRRPPLLRREAAPLELELANTRTRRPPTTCPRRATWTANAGPVGIARLVRSGSTAEIAFAVADEYQAVSGRSSRASSPPTRALRVSRISWPRCAATTRASLRSCSGSDRSTLAGAGASASSSSGSSPRVPSRACPPSSPRSTATSSCADGARRRARSRRCARSDLVRGSSPPRARSTSRPTGSTRSQRAESRIRTLSWSSTAQAPTA